MLGRRGRRTGGLLALALLAAGTGCTAGSHRSPPPSGPTAVAISTPPTVTSLDAHRALVATASWSRPVDGYRLHVHPTLLGRTFADQYPARALRQSIRLAGVTPLPLTRSIRASLRNQLRCHGEFAPHKPVWDLESWRPAVSYLSTVLHECNP